MMRVRELPGAIYRAINNWRLWITLALLASLIVNEAVRGVLEGQTIVEALTRVSYFKMALLVFVCGVIAQATIGAVPFVIGVAMTMIDFALRRRQQWREEGAQAERERSERTKELWQERWRERQRAIAAISADPELSDAAKLRAIAVINAAEAD